VRFALLLLAGGCTVPFALPGLQMEGGAGASTHPVLHAAIGAHLASNTTRALPVDVGAGYVADVATNAGDHTTQGVYLEASGLEGRVARRTGLGLRGVLLVGDSEVGGGAMLRVTHEAFTPASGAASSSDRCGAAVGASSGMAGLGLYAEFGRQRPPGEPATWVATVGVTVRTPAVIGIAIVIPHCH
jgi:hypothetical protein